MIPYHRIAAQFFMRPLLLTPAAADTISTFLLSRRDMAAGGSGGEDDSGESRQYFRAQAREDGSLEAHSSRMSRFYGQYPLDESGRPMPFRRTEDGTAILTLVGEWVNRGAWVGASSGLISYEAYKYQLARAVGDPKTTRIVLDLESPGGEAVGAFEAAAATRAAAAEKPVVAVVNGMAASAAYAIASGASRIVTIPTGMSGSIGVVIVHLDYSKWLAEEGIKPTLIFAGDHKVDGNPFEPLPKEVQADLKAEVSSFYTQFVETVTSGRRISADAVRATQARVFKGQDAVDAGLADEVGTFEDVLADKASAGGRKPVQTRRASMDTNDQPAPNATAGMISKADHDAAVASATEVGKNAGATAERARFKAVQTSEHYAGREASAIHMLNSTDMSAEAIVGVLATMPAAQPASKDAPQLDNRGALGISTLGATSPKKAEASLWDEAVAEANASLKTGRAS